jgi:UDP-GlcNAc:undecaprenyl-phosphate GlcNAc-1-phosphate transferase
MLKNLFIFIFSGIFLTTAYFLYYSLKILDKPKLYGFNRKPVVYSFGLALILLFSFLAFLFNPLSYKLVSLLLSIMILSVSCFLDDRFNLSPVLRLIIQTLCAFFVVSNGISVLEVSNPFVDSNFILGQWSRF